MKQKPKIFAINKQATKHTRRDFLKGSLAAGSAVLGSGLITGCGEDETSEVTSYYSSTMLHEEYPNQMDIHPDGSILASASYDSSILSSSRLGNIKLWSLPEGNEISTIDLKSNVLKFTPDGQFLVTAGSGNGYVNRINLLSPTDYEVALALDGHTNTIEHVAFSSNNKLMASSDRNKTIKLWSMPNGELLHTFNALDLYINSLALSPDGKLIAIGTNGTSLDIWSTETFELVTSIPATEYAYHYVDFSPDGTQLAFQTENEQVKIINTSNWTKIKQFKANNESIKQLAYSCDGSKIITRSKHQVAIYDIDKNEITDGVISYNSHDELNTKTLTSMAYSCDSNILAIGDTLGAIKLYQMPGSKQIATNESECTCDTVCTCDTISSSGDSTCTCNTIGVCNCNTVDGSSGGGSYWFPN